MDALTSLANLLEQKDHSLFRHWNDLRIRTHEILRDDIFDSRHRGRAIQHTIALERLLDSLVPTSVKAQMSALEILVLLASILFHDIGMEIKGAHESDEDVAKDHHIRSQNYVMDKKKQLELDDAIAEAIGQVCYGHTIRIDLKAQLPKVITLADSAVRLQFLTALLRLADMLEIEVQPPLLDVTQGCWKIKEVVRNISIDAAFWSIRIHPHENYAGSRDILHALQQCIQKDLERNSSILRVNGILYNRVEIESLHEYAAMLHGKLLEMEGEVRKLTHDIESQGKKLDELSRQILDQEQKEKEWRKGRILELEKNIDWLRQDRELNKEVTATKRGHRIAWFAALAALLSAVAAFLSPLASAVIRRWFGLP
jgi:hypothetical protein